MRAAIGYAEWQRRPQRVAVRRPPAGGAGDDRQRAVRFLAAGDDARSRAARRWPGRRGARLWRGDDVGHPDGIDHEGRRPRAPARRDVRRAVRGDHAVPGRRPDRPHLGDQPLRHRGVRQAVPGSGGDGVGRGAVRRPDRARRRTGARSGLARDVAGGVVRVAHQPPRSRRRAHRRDLLADRRWCRRRPAGDSGAGRDPGSAPASAPRRLGTRRQRPGPHAHRADARDPSCCWSAPGCASATSTCSR